MALRGDNGGVHLTHSICDAAPYRDTAFKRVPAEAGAALVNQREFCMPDGRGNPEFTLVNSHFQEKELPERQVRRHPNANRRWGIRLGPNACCEATNHLVQTARTPPALRKSSSRGVLGLLRAHGQFGFPPSMHADA